jgi:hypothetical protein
MVFVHDVGRKQWGICRASCGLNPMARFDAIQIMLRNKYSCYNYYVYKWKRTVSRVELIMIRLLLCS